MSFAVTSGESSLACLTFFVVVAVSREPGLIASVTSSAVSREPCLAVCDVLCCAVDRESSLGLSKVCSCSCKYGKTKSLHEQ